MVVQVCILSHIVVFDLCSDVVHSLRGPNRRSICKMCTNDSEIDCSLRCYTFDAVCCSFYIAKDLFGFRTLGLYLFLPCQVV